MGHKMKDGIKVELSLEEEKEIRDYQAMVKAEEDAQIKAIKDKQDMKKNVLRKIQTSLGLSDDEINTLI